jgi:hypothetical protein
MLPASVPTLAASATTVTDAPTLRHWLSQWHTTRASTTRASTDWLTEFDVEPLAAGHDELTGVETELVHDGVTVAWMSVTYFA